MLSGAVLNSNATLNNFQEIGSITIIRGEEITLKLRITNRQLGIRYVPASGAVVSVIFNNAAGKVEKTATVEVDDRSIASVTLSETDTADILSGDIKIKVVEGTVTKLGILVDALRMVTDC